MSTIVPSDDTADPGEEFDDELEDTLRNELIQAGILDAAPRHTRPVPIPHRPPLPRRLS